MDEIRVAVLDDHQGIVDGYKHRLRNDPAIQIVASAMFGNELEEMLTNNLIDVLILDTWVPMSENNLNPYPFLHVIPKTLQVFPDLHILVISAYCEYPLVKGAVEVGASGYILKGDRTSIRNLAHIINLVAQGGRHFSEKALQLLFGGNIDSPQLTARQYEALSLAASYPHEKSQELANRMSIAPSTARNLLSEAYATLGVNSRVEAIIKAIELGLIPQIKSYSTTFGASTTD